MAYYCIVNRQDECLCIVLLIYGRQTVSLVIIQIIHNIGMFQPPIQQSEQRTAEKKKRQIFMPTKDQSSFNATEGDLHDALPNHMQQLKQIKQALEDQKDNPESKEREKSKSKGLKLMTMGSKVKIVVGITSVVIVSTLIWFLVIYLSSIHQLEQMKSNRLTFNEDYNQKTTSIEGVQYKWKDTNGEDITAVVSTTILNETSTVTRLLQEDNTTNITNTPAVNQTTTIIKKSTSIELTCRLTGISISVTSQTFESNIFVPINKLFTLLLQYEKGNTKSKKTRFFYDAAVIRKAIQKVVEKGKQDTRVTVEEIYTKTYNQSTHTFQAAKQVTKAVETERLISPSEIPRIQNIQDNQELAEGMATIVQFVLRNAGTVIRQILPEMLKENKVEMLVTNVKGLTALRDQPSDVQKLCTTANLSTNSYSCTAALWKSQVLPVGQKKEGKGEAVIMISTII